jgi:steroid delta-isomerase-like uncharacterized protein
MTTAADPMVALGPYIEGWQARNVDLILSACTDDIVFDESPTPEPVRGKEAFREYLTSMFEAFPDLTLEATNVTPAAEQVWAEWVMKGTQRGDLMGIPAKGKRMDLRGCSVFVTRGGKLAEERLYWDAATLQQQLG